MDFGSCPLNVHTNPTTWRIIPLSNWLVIMVSKTPNWMNPISNWTYRVSVANRWLGGMILQVRSTDSKFDPGLIQFGKDFAGILSGTSWRGPPFAARTFPTWNPVVEVRGFRVWRHTANLFHSLTLSVHPILHDSPPLDDKDDSNQNAAKMVLQASKQALDFRTVTTK